MHKEKNLYNLTYIVGFILTLFWAMYFYDSQLKAFQNVFLGVLFGDWIVGSTREMYFVFCRLYPPPPPANTAVFGS